ncbi:DUF4167 domain-containing protein [Amylibacter sp.]|nr:DUF4167 domain-containing protein [Amylibacter sp.]MDB4008761.1 DUF4167 domain-containing protein [Amylibacter sp.]MDC1264101.1 DUF4167 domain-containing protein [Amylibacter sp.]MDC1348192.1 DUF4167 domain-containing protein [Amylibacter sp.]
MRTSNKSRSRNKNNNRRQNPGNVINRVFDSSGPEGRVRGTPQQIIDKYQSLASDAMLAGDRIAHENFLQHSEHYSRLLVVAQKELDAKREQQQKQHENRPQNNSNANDETQLNSNIKDEVIVSEVLENDQDEIKSDELEQKNKKRLVKKKIEIIHEETPKTLDEGKIES